MDDKYSHSVNVRRKLLVLAFAAGQVYSIRQFFSFYTMDELWEKVIIVIAVIGNFLYTYFSIVFTGDWKALDEIFDGPNLSRVLMKSINIMLIVLLVAPGFILLSLLTLMAGYKGKTLRRQLSQDFQMMRRFIREFQDFPLRFQVLYILGSILIYIFNFFSWISLDFIKGIYNVSQIIIAVLLFAIAYKNVQAAKITTEGKSQ